MGMVAVMDGATVAGADIITDGAEVVATIMVGGIIDVGDLILPTRRRPPQLAASFVLLASNQP